MSLFPEVFLACNALMHSFKAKSDLKRSYDELYLTHKFEKALEIYNKLQNFTKKRTILVLIFLIL